MKWRGLPYRDFPSRGGSAFPDSPRSEELRHKYLIARWSIRYSAKTILRSIRILDLLDHAPNFTLPTEGRILDIGAGDWRYLPGLDAWLRDRFRAHRLQVAGIERDAYKLNLFLNTPLSTARFFSKRARNESIAYRYRSGDVKGLHGSYELITWFFPVLDSDGVSILKYVKNILSRDGYLITATSGEKDLDSYRSLLTGLRATHTKKLDNSFGEKNDQPIFLTLWTRDE